ncbi:MAG: hypothetical protein AAGD32_03790 [Planctomycetota bacterium]
MAAVNETRKMAGSELYGDDLEAQIPVKMLETIDVVHGLPARIVKWIWFSGVLDNVDAHNNYYQTKAGNGEVRINGAQNSVGTGFSSLLKGSVLPSTIASNNVNVTTDPNYANRMTTQIWNGSTFLFDGGSDVNHDVAPLFVWQDVRLDIIVSGLGS